MQTYYKLAFQTLQNFCLLGIMNDEEKQVLKDYFLNSLNLKPEISQDQMSTFILQKLQMLRKKIAKETQLFESLCQMEGIEEETDEDDLN